MPIPQKKQKTLYKNFILYYLDESRSHFFIDYF